jgi:16S rRNA (uracil1498-N3)-methyltransferase
MTRRRWIADEVIGNRAALTGAHARHLAQVLRAKAGQEFEISTGADLRLGRIVHVDSNRIDFELGDVVGQPVQFDITVAISIFKFDRMEWAIEKSTELGVARIIPLIASRSESHLVSAASNRLERWRRIAQSASEQARRVSSPEIGGPVKLDALLAASHGERLVLSEVESDRSLRHAVPADSSSLTLAFGPEGGWRNDELDAFVRSGWTATSLGPTILRVETAVIAALAVANSVLLTNYRDKDSV